MKRVVIVLTVIFMLTACVANRAAYEASLRNSDASADLALRLPREDVLFLMGPPDFRDSILGTNGETIERLKWLTDYDHHIYTVVELRGGMVVAITQEEGPAP